MNAVSTVRRASALDDVPGADMRAILAKGGTLAMAPQWLADAGGYAMAARWDGKAFRVFDTTGDCRGIFASWNATDRALMALGEEWIGSTS